MKIAFRNLLATLRRYKISSLLNIIGLAMAFTVCYIITARVWRDVTWNGAFCQADRTMLVAVRTLFGDDSSDTRLMPWLARPTLERVLPESPEVEAYAAVTAGVDGRPEDEMVWVRRRRSLEPEKFSLLSNTVYSVSPGLLQLLPFRTVAGDLTRMAEPRTVIIARSEAERLGVEVGALLCLGEIGRDGEDEVVGIFEDLPENGYYRSLKLLRNIGETYMQDANQWATFYFLRLAEHADVRRLTERMDTVDLQVRQADRKAGYSLLPVRSLRFHRQLDWSGETGSRAAVLTLIGVAVAIILIALINFINFFIALLPVRLRVVNVYKVFGAPTRALRMSFLVEAVGFVVLALLLGFYATILMMDLPTDGIFSVPVEVWKNPVPALIVCGISVAAVLAAALWPAHYITSFPPAMAGGRFVGSPRGRRLRTVLIGVQFVIAQVLILMTLVMWSQYRYMRTSDKGFETSSLLVASLPLSLCDVPGRQHLAAALEREPGVRQLGFAFEVLPKSHGSWNQSCTLPNGEKAYFAMINCDTGLVRTLGLRVTEGRDFRASDNPAEDREGMTPLIINRAAQLEYGLGADSIIPSLHARVCGVVEDFNYCSMHFASRPLIFKLLDWYCPILYIRINPTADLGRIGRTLAQAAREIRPTVVPEEITLRFYDQAQAQVYLEDRNTAVVISLFSLLAIVIALMGVFGLVLFEMRQRRREIALRRVMGATGGEILAMINRRYLAIVSVCSLVSLPVSLWMAERWLSTFVYRMEGVWLCFVGAVAVTVAVTAVTVTLRARSAANENPAEAVKSEY